MGCITCRVRSGFSISSSNTASSAPRSWLTRALTSIALQAFFEACFDEKGGQTLTWGCGVVATADVTECWSIVRSSHQAVQNDWGPGCLLRRWPVGQPLPPRDQPAPSRLLTAAQAVEAALTLWKPPCRDLYREAKTPMLPLHEAVCALKIQMRTRPSTNKPLATRTRGPLPDASSDLEQPPPPPRKKKKLGRNV